MRRWSLGLVLVAILFLLVNRAAYRGYFRDDELDTLTWAPHIQTVSYLEGVLSPRFALHDFRPVGHFYFCLAGRLFHLEFSWYVALLHLLHLIQFTLLWMTARTLRAPPVAALLGCVFFAFHMALFDAFWKPMYVFDVLCAIFCMLSLLLYAKRQWVLSLLAFWLAYKSKELAVMLPAVLACYELWMGDRRWTRLIPFFAVSFSFGLQGLLLNPNRNNDYTFHFTLAAFTKTSVYYAGRVFLLPYLGFALPLLAFLGKNRRVWLGLAMAALTIVPLLFLPGRIFSAYCYLPFSGLALAVSGLAESVGPLPVAVFLALFAPLSLHELRAQRNVTLQVDSNVRAWMTAVGGFARANPHIDGAVWSGAIPDFHIWGVEGGIRDEFGHDLPIARDTSPNAGRVLSLPRVAAIAWNPGTRRASVTLHTPASAPSSAIDFNGAVPFWQLERGWRDPEAGYRWCEPVAVARLARPENAARFAVRLLAPPDQLAQNGSLTVRVWLDRTPLDERKVSASGWQSVEWDLAPSDVRSVSVTLRVDPPYRPGGDTLGAAVVALGFASVKSE